MGGHDILVSEAETAGGLYYNLYCRSCSFRASGHELDVLCQAHDRAAGGVTDAELIHGPWYASEQDDHWSVHASDPDAPPLGNLVCTLPLGEQGAARARLIAGAPGMYRALTSIREAGLGGYLTPALCAEIVTGALEKAEGR